MKKTDWSIKSLTIGLASPDRIKEWSYGEVKKPETINYKTLKPEAEGLFDEVIFGPVKDYECSCGKYKKVKHKGHKCEKCNVEITESIVRRERMGHISLAHPVAHIWMTKELPNPSKISLLLDIPYKDVEQVVYYINHIVLDEGTYKYEGKKIFNKKEIVDLSNPKNNIKTRTKLRRILKDIYRDLKDKKTNDPIIKFDIQRAKTYDVGLADKNLPFSITEVFGFIKKYTGIEFGLGAAAIQKLLKNLNLETEFNETKEKLNQYKDPNDPYVRKLLRRLETITWFKESKNKPEWMILDAIPVTPPDTRPIIQLDGGRFTTSDINAFYRRIIIRNERLVRMNDSFAPTILLDNERRMLQEAVDSLFDNQARKKPVLGRDKRPLKSFTNHLKGKQGLFRQNLLGKRVDYSGRSVIVIGPELKMYEVGIPATMILKLFKPFIINKLLDKKDEEGNEIQPLAFSIKQAENLINRQDAQIWPTVERVIKDRPVLLNRAPTLHRLGIQAFKVKMVDGKAIRLHPLVTTAFNADFDGDQMAVHVPLSKEAVAEARSIMLASLHILGPKDGKPIVTPTQDIILGNYYLSKEKKGALGEGSIFNSYDEAILALENKVVDIHAIIGIPTSFFEYKTFPKDGILLTTIGKLIFNNALPINFDYINTLENNKTLNDNDIIDYHTNIFEAIANKKLNQPFNKKLLGFIIDILYKRYSDEIDVVPKTLDNLKQLGFKYSTISATSISLFDVPDYDKKYEYFVKADEEVKKLNEYANRGWLDDAERYTKVVSLWSNIKDHVTNDIENIVKSDEYKDNPIIVMANSGARGNISNFTQLAGMRGLMSKSFNYDQKSKSKVIRDTIEIPIKHSFIEGLTVSEYFNSTYGARKGLTDTAMKTSKSGYMTRKLVDVSQEVIINNYDCETTLGLKVSDIIETSNNQLIEPLKDRIVGRYSLINIYAKDSNELIVDNNTLITNEIADKIIENGYTEVIVRSPLHCNNEYGICQKCFGLDLSTKKLVKSGVAIGVIAAQSIGEPGTQLTMRTFHTGGVSGESNITQGFERLKQLFEFTPPKKHEKAIISEISGKVTDISINDNFKVVEVSNNKQKLVYEVPLNAKLRVEKNQEIQAGAKISDGSINIEELLLIAGLKEVRNYILKEVQKVYRIQGIEISDKYIEVIINQLTNKGAIVNEGDYDCVIGEIISINKFKRICQELLANNKKPPAIIPKIYGLENAPSKSGSFLSAASFQDTKKILTDAACKSDVDKLLGLKENIILGKIIPAGTGLMNPEDIIELGNKMLKKEY